MQYKTVQTVGHLEPLSQLFLKQCCFLVCIEYDLNRPSTQCFYSVMVIGWLSLYVINHLNFLTWDCSVITMATVGWIIMVLLHQGHLDLLQSIGLLAIGWRTSLLLSYWWSCPLVIAQLIDKKHFLYLPPCPDWLMSASCPVWSNCRFWFKSGWLCRSM